MATETRPRRSTSGSKRRKTFTIGSSPKQRALEVVTVGDDVQITNDLQGVVRFVGEIVQRSGIYYGIELNEDRGKNNGTLRMICYFKCKPKRGVFVRRTRIQRVLHSKRNSHKGTIHRIGINQRIQINMSSYSVVGNIRFIGTPSKANGIYYGLELAKPVSDTNGIYNETRYFTTDENCAYFIKANSKRITYPVSVSTPPPSGSSHIKISSDLLKKHQKPSPEQPKKRRKYSSDTNSDDTENASSDSDDTDSDESSESKDDELRFMEYHKYYKNREKQLYKNPAVQCHSSDSVRKNPLKIIGNEWMINAQNADTFKKRYDCTRSLMEKVCGNKSKLPLYLNFGGDAINLLRLFSDWLHVERHIVVRKHMLQLLVPIGNTSYPVSVWKGAGMQLAESLITTEWFEKKRGFIHLVTPALIAVYIGSYSQIKDWEPWLTKVLTSSSRAHINAQNECCDFLCKLLEISVMRKSMLWILEDLMRLMEDGTFMDMITKVVNKIKDRRVRLRCCLFAYGIAHSFVENQEIQKRYTTLAEIEDLKLYFDAIEQSKYKSLFKPLTTKETSPKAVGKQPRKSYQVKAKMQTLEPSISAPVNVSDHEESMVLEPNKKRRRTRSRSRRSASMSSSRLSSNEEMDDVLAVIQMDVEHDLDEKLNEKAIDEDGTDDILSDDLDHDLDDDLHDDLDEDDDKEAENEEDKEEIDDIKEPLLHELCPNCIKRKAKMETLTLQLHALQDEMKSLHKLMSGVKSEGNDIEEDKKIWIMNLENEKNRYKKNDTKMKAMEQQLYELRQKVYELKELDQERLDILDPKHLKQWTSRHILTWILSLDHGNYLKFENNVRRLLIDRDINGASLINGDLNESDIRSSGIHRFRDRKKLMKHMDSLVEQYKDYQRDANVEKKEQDDEFLMVDVSVMSGSVLSEQKEPGNVSVKSGSVLSEQMEGRIKEQQMEEKQEKEEEKEEEEEEEKKREQQPGGNIQQEEEKKKVIQKEEEANNKKAIENKDKKENKGKQYEEADHVFECNQCYLVKKEDQGYDDENGVWYCLTCWDEFNAEQQHHAMGGGKRKVQKEEEVVPKVKKKEKEKEKRKNKKKRKSKSLFDIEDVEKVHMQNSESKVKENGNASVGHKNKEEDEKIQNEDRALHRIEEEQSVSSDIQTENSKSEDAHLNIADPGSPVIHMQISPATSNKSDSMNKPRRMSF